MSKEVEWSSIHCKGEIVCTCDQCYGEERIGFEGGYPDFKASQAELKAYGWVSRNIDNEWYDFCSEECYYDYINDCCRRFI